MVFLTMAVALLGGIVILTLGVDAGAGTVRWLVSGYALVIAGIQLVQMVKGLLVGRWGIDVLAVMAIVATVSVGEYWASLIIVFMLSGGEALEDYAAGRAKRELSALLSRSPQLAHVIAAPGREAQDIPVADVRVGDVLLLKPSEVIPVDGTLLSAEGTFDESSLTGESLPVERSAGEAVLSGALNGVRAVTMRATARAADSQYQRIVALVSEAAESRAPVVRLADRYAVPFTVASLAIAGLAWWLAGDPVRFAEVLVVATPCPLLIAAPVAFMGGMSRAARSGIIVKNGGTLEQLARAKTVAFDKTGTLTHGEPAVVAVRPAPGFSENELLMLVASAEQYSSHVLAKFLLARARERGLELLPAVNASEAATDGVVATIAGRPVVVGKRRLVAEHVGDVDAAEVASGQLAVYVGIDGVFAGTIILRDKLRANASATLAALTSLGVVRTMMLTGDAEQTADHVARELGIGDTRAELLPIGKVEAVRTVTDRPVIMVGDGVNDAPVLAVADVGIAMGAKGSTAASESADVVILLDDLSKVAQAVATGQRTIRVAVESIWIGIVLSLGLMLVAAFGFLPAVVGAVLQEVVDLATILNALRALGGRNALPAGAAEARTAGSPVATDSAR